MAPSEYKAMWLFAMFDLPVKTKSARREYTRFRTFLLTEGFHRLQYSIYARYCANEESANTFRQHIRKRLPPEGNIRLVAITDRQFGKMEVFFGRKKVKPEDAPDQLLLF